VFGIANADTGLAIDGKFTLDVETTALLPRGIEPAEACELARLAVTSWLILFEHVGISADDEGAALLIDVPDPRLCRVLVQLAQSLTGMDLVVASKDRSSLTAALRAGRDAWTSGFENFRDAAKSGRIKWPRHVILSVPSAPETSLIQGSDIAMLYQSEIDVGAVRLLNIVWANIADWSLVRRSRYAVADILTEIAILIEAGNLTADGGGLASSNR
jgi:hypothetical protein